MPALLRVIIVVDQLFEFIKFVGLDFLKFHSEGLFINPLNLGFSNRQWGLKPWDHQTDDDHFPWEDVQFTLKFRPAERKVERMALDFMRVPQQESLNLGGHTPVPSSFHYTLLVSILPRAPSTGEYLA